MIIQSVSLENYRNYETLTLELDEGRNLFYGGNAQGKTNILESVFVGGTTRSHRGTRDKDLIRFGCEEAHIRMNILKEDLPYRIDMHLRKNRSKAIAVNGVPIRRAGELLELGGFVFFSPEDLQIIKSGPSDRRRFMDMQLCQQSAVYLKNLADYNRALAQRGRVLREMAFGGDEMLLSVWDEQLIRCGRALIREREELCVALNELIAPIHLKLSGGKEHLKVIYRRDVEADDFAQALLMNREKDIRMKMTCSGPHRDDLSFEADGIELRRFGSQGQQRTGALSLKLAQIELIRRVKGDRPILLLDDVLSELDEDRQHFLLGSIDNVQALITCTGVEDFTRNGFVIDRLFHVEGGRVFDKGITEKQEDSDGGYI